MKLICTQSDDFHEMEITSLVLEITFLLISYLRSLVSGRSVRNDTHSVQCMSPRNGIGGERIPSFGDFISTPICGIPAGREGNSRNQKRGPISGGQQQTARGGVGTVNSHILEIVI